MAGRVECPIRLKVGKVWPLGPFHTKLILPVNRNVKAKAVKPECFSVYVERKDHQGGVLMLPKSWSELEVKVPSKGYCVVKDAYPSSPDGERKEEGEFIMLEMKFRPFDLLTPIAAPNGQHEFVICDYRITQIAEIPTEAEPLSGLVFDRCAGDTMKQAEKFLHGISSYKEEPLTYGYFVPQTGNGRRPLMIWLHGAGEGGQDPTVAYAGNKW